MGHLDEVCHPVLSMRGVRIIMLVPLVHVGVIHYAARATSVSVPPLSGPGP